MALFKKLFKKEEKEVAYSPKGFVQLVVSEVIPVTKDAIKISFDIPNEEKPKFKFLPGQYLNLSLNLEGKEQRRSYSICSGKNEKLAIAVKVVKNGLVSSYLKQNLKAGDQLFVAAPEGNFTLKEKDLNVIAFAAGSGITPIMSIAKEFEFKNGNLNLFYANKTEDTILFKEELTSLKNVKTNFYLSQESKEGYLDGRFSKEIISSIIKQNLDLLKADAFFICGPEEMILSISEILHFFGVSKEKIHFELFTTPVLMQDTTEIVSDFQGISKVKVILDEENIEFNLKNDGKSILETLTNEGYDPPYSCRGAVCCTCKAKVLKGKATMKMNYSLTDQEVKDGYILTCQAHPASEELVLSYDEK